MNISEWLLFFQDIVLLLTGLIVAWYTVETYKIRKDAAIQNKLIAEQLRIMQESLDFELQRVNRASEPLFRFEGEGLESNYLNNSDECSFFNDGGSISKLSLHPSVSFKEATIWPTESIPTKQKGKVYFVTGLAPMPSKYEFEIRFTTELGKLGMQKFSMRHGNRPTRIA